MIVTTTHSIDDARITGYLGIVSGYAEVDLGKASSEAIESAKAGAIADMIARAKALGADAVVGVSIDYHKLVMAQSADTSVCVNGTAVTLAS